MRPTTWSGVAVRWAGARPSDWPSSGGYGVVRTGRSAPGPTTVADCSNGVIVAADFAHLGRQHQQRLRSDTPGQRRPGPGGHRFRSGRRGQLRRSGLHLHHRRLPPGRELHHHAAGQRLLVLLVRRCRATSWTYSQLGAEGLHPEAGSVEAWVFGGGPVGARPRSPHRTPPRRHHGTRRNHHDHHHAPAVPSAIPPPTSAPTSPVRWRSSATAGGPDRERTAVDGSAASPGGTFRQRRRAVGPTTPTEPVDRPGHGRTSPPTTTAPDRAGDQRPSSSPRIVDAAPVSARDQGPGLAVSPSSSVPSSSPRWPPVEASSPGAGAGPAEPVSTGAHRWSLAGAAGCRGRCTRWPGGCGPSAWPPRSAGPPTRCCSLLVLAVLGVVVANRRSDAPWARAFKYYLYLALTVIAIRVVFRAVFGGDIDASDMHVLFGLPPHPAALVGRRACRSAARSPLEGTLSAALRRAATRVPAVLPRRGQRAGQSQAGPAGAARAPCTSSGWPWWCRSASPPSWSRACSGSAGPAGSAAEAAGGLPRPAQHRDPGHGGRAGAFAAAGRGHGLARLRPHRRRLRTDPPDHRRAHAGRACADCASGAYGLLDSSAPGGCSDCRRCSVGAVLCCAGLALGGRRVGRSQYRPDPWRLPEWIVSVRMVPARRPDGRCGSASDTGLNPSFDPLRWPSPAAGAGAGHPGRRRGRGGRPATGIARAVGPSTRCRRREPIEPSAAVDPHRAQPMEVAA